MSVFDTTCCQLGEGPIWHPGRGQLFWFDILANRLHTQVDGKPQHWQFGENVSAAGWVDDRTLLIASETALFRYDLVTGDRTDLIALEADDPATRSNDGRADPQGGFWIGTMAKAEPGKPGAIYRYYRGELRKLFGGIVIPNAICFPPGGRHAHFTDTAKQQVMKVALDGDGWPVGQPEVFLDLRADGLFPDGAVIDADGTMWLAQWGAFRVAAYDTLGRFLRAVPFAAAQTSCPAFGGPGLDTLFCTSAAKGLTPEQLAAHPDSGMTFAAPGIAKGQPEHRVIL